MSVGDRQDASDSRAVCAYRASAFGRQSVWQGAIEPEIWPRQRSGAVFVPVVFQFRDGCRLSECAQRIMRAGEGRAVHTRIFPGGRDPSAVERDIMGGKIKKKERKAP